MSPLAEALHEASKIVNAAVGGSLHPDYCQQLADEMERAKPIVVIKSERQ